VYLPANIFPAFLAVYTLSPQLEQPNLIKSAVWERGFLRWTLSFSSSKNLRHEVPAEIFLYLFQVDTFGKKSAGRKFFIAAPFVTSWILNFMQNATVRPLKGERPSMRGIRSVKGCGSEWRRLEVGSRRSGGLKKVDLRQKKGERRVPSPF